MNRLENAAGSSFQIGATWLTGKFNRLAGARLYNDTLIAKPRLMLVTRQAHSNGVESFWSLLKRGYYETCHKMNPKPLNCYVNKFARRHNVRNRDSIEQAAVESMPLKRLKYSALIADNGLSSGARS